MNYFYFLIFITAFASAVSQILLNVSAKKQYKNKLYEYLNPWVISSYVILGLTLLANIYIMQFVPLKIAHVLAASTYIFVAIMSRIIFKEKFSITNILGLCLIMIGIVVFIL